MPSTSRNKQDYKCFYMDLANMLIYHGTELVSANDPESVRKINVKAVAEAKKFIGRLDPPVPKPKIKDISKST